MSSSKLLLFFFSFFKGTANPVFYCKSPLLSVYGHMSAELRERLWQFSKSEHMKELDYVLNIGTVTHRGRAGVLPEVLVICF